MLVGCFRLGLGLGTRLLTPLYWRLISARGFEDEDATALRYALEGARFS